MKVLINDTIIELTDEQYKAQYGDSETVLAQEIRFQRNKLLADTDWTQLADSQLTEEKKQAYAVYRQALRDITEQEGFPLSVVFPTL